MYDFEPVSASPDNLGQCHELLRRVFPSSPHLTTEYLDWQYNQNPAGKVVGFNAYHNKQLAAHYVTIPVIAKVLGRQVKGLLSLNTATHPDHQGKGLFTVLANQTYARGFEMGYEFVVGVANANSTPGLVGKLGFQLVSPLEAKIGVGEVARKTAYGHIDFERFWDSALLEWRLRNPSSAYRRAQGRRGRYILAPTGKLCIQAILGEFSADAYPACASALTGSLLPSVKLWIGLDCNINWSSSLYMDVPKQLKPSPLNLIFKDLTGENHVLSPDRVTFHAIDFDAY